MEELSVYILSCSDNSYYVGVTNNVSIRFEQHNEGLDPSCYRYKRRPIELLWRNKFQSTLEAIKWEKKIKGWTRKKKEALIEGKFEVLAQLAECKNETHFKNKVKGFDSTQPDV
ncbi:MAG: GIY-YIG nuclease family protein [Bacteroidetes bacterium]|nr:GIY-YIG nuclease family protein [Bacteroidota bacterium]